MDAYKPMNFNADANTGLVQLNLPSAHKDPVTPDPVTGMKKAVSFASTNVNDTYMQPTPQGMTMAVQRVGVYHQEIPRMQW
jgi:hypothetical protein